MARLSALVVLGVLALTACSTGTSSPPPGPNASPISPASTTRTVRIGQAWDVPGWRITATGVTCGASAGANGAGPACVLHLTYINTGSQPALFTGTAGSTTSPIYGATGYDEQGQAYGAAHSLESETNPGASGAATLEFATGPGVHLVRVDLAGVSLRL